MVKRTSKLRKWLYSLNCQPMNGGTQRLWSDILNRRNKSQQNTSIFFRYLKEIFQVTQELRKYSIPDVCCTRLSWLPTRALKGRRKGNVTASSAVARLIDGRCGSELIHSVEGRLIVDCRFDLADCWWRGRLKLLIDRPNAGVVRDISSILWLKHPIVCHGFYTDQMESMRLRRAFKAATEDPAVS